MRITPACAGKTRLQLLVPACPEDHPRVCGENVFSGMLICWQIGSPPRVRGKLALTLAKKKSKRITPACAGKTKRYGTAWNSHKDHPRVCGENSTSA